jgi:hypothetical protein
MAWKDILDSGLKFAEKVLADASLWFWLGVAIVVLLVADSRGLIPLGQAIAQPRVGLTIGLVVIGSLWLNALDVHRPLGRAATAAREWVAERRARFVRERQAGRVRPGTEETLRDLLRTRCRERRWFLWFVTESERDPNLLLPYGTILTDEEFVGARSLLKHGLLHRTGDSDSALVFVHKRLHDVYKTAIAQDPALAQELATENDLISNRGRQSLREELPSYATERFFRTTGRQSPERAT